MDRFGADLLSAAVDRAVEALAGPAGAQVVSEARARHVCEQLAQRAYQAGRDAAIRELRTTDDAIAELGRSRATITALARRYEIGWRIGRDWLFRPDDIERLRAIIAGLRPGRPRQS